MAKVSVQSPTDKAAEEKVKSNAKNKPAANSVAALRERVEELEAVVALLLAERTA